jgi:hypothetical protein
MIAALLAPFLAALSSASSTPAPAAQPPAVEIRDIAPPVDVFPYPPWMVVTAACVAAVLLALIVRLIVRWVRRRPAPPPPTPRAIALRELERLRPQVQVLDPHEFSFPVSDVLRTYIGAEYHLHAPRQTSPEFLATISGSAKFSDADRTLLAAFLERCDLIKFARIDASSDDSAGLLESAISFVQGGRA